MSKQKQQLYEWEQDEQLYQWVDRVLEFDGTISLPKGSIVFDSYVAGETESGEFIPLEQLKEDGETDRIRRNVVVFSCFVPVKRRG